MALTKITTPELFDFSSLNTEEVKRKATVYYQSICRFKKAENSAIGRQLKSTEIADLDCIIADAVLAGSSHQCYDSRVAHHCVLGEFSILCFADIVEPHYNRPR